MLKDDSVLSNKENYFLREWLTGFFLLGILSSDIFSLLTNYPDMATKTVFIFYSVPSPNENGDLNYGRPVQCSSLDYKFLQVLVGGNLEAVPQPSDNKVLRGLVAYCDEDGVKKKLRENELATGVLHFLGFSIPAPFMGPPLLGNVLIHGVNQSGDPIGLTPSQIAKLEETIESYERLRDLSADSLESMKKNCGVTQEETESLAGVTEDEIYDQIIPIISTMLNLTENVKNQIKLKRNNFIKAMKNVPIGEIEYHRKGADIMEKEELLGGDTIPDSIKTLRRNPDILRGIVAGLRWGNRVCNNNFSKKCNYKRGDKLAYCTRCYLVQYCCGECQKEDHPTHKKFCGHPETRERDMGPQRSVFGTIKDGVNVQIKVDDFDK